MKTAANPLPDTAPAASAPPALLEGTTFRFAHVPALETQAPEETRHSEPNEFAAFAASEEERLRTAARAQHRRRAGLKETGFRWATALLLLSSGAAALWRLLWMGQ